LLRRRVSPARYPALGQQGARLDPVGGLQVQRHRLALVLITQAVEQEVTLVLRFAGDVELRDQGGLRSGFLEE